MEFFGTLLNILDADMQTPTVYGWFHVMFLALSVIAGIWLCRARKGADERFVRRFLIVSAVVAIVFEVYKQINYTFSYDGSVITADYQWYIFPFQFCSTPMYVSLLAGIIPNQKWHSSLCAYLGTFALFAGFCVMVYPAQVFVPTIGINIQTMICHGLMITVGIFLLGSGYVKAEHRTICKAIPVFAVCVVIAFAMNEIAHISGLLKTEIFNMFFISPYCEPSLPVYSLVQAVVPYPWCLIIYVVGFSAAAYIVLLVAMLVKRCCVLTVQRRGRNLS